MGTNMDKTGDVCSKPSDSSELRGKHDRTRTNIKHDIQLAFDYNRTGNPPAQKISRTIDEKLSAASDQGTMCTKNIDGGYAWAILAVVFIMNASTFGTARAYGLIFQKMVREGGLNRSEAALPFKIMGAVENMSGLLCGCLLTLFGSWRLTVVSGSILVTLGHLLAALWAESQVGQLLSVGLMCGVGMGFVSISLLQINNAYFNRCRSRALGVSLTGTTAGTIIISPLCLYLLDNYDGTHICYLALGICSAPNIFLALLLKQQSQKTQHTIENSQINALRPTTTSMLNGAHQCRERNIGKLEEANSNGRFCCVVNRTDISIWTCVKRILSNPYFHLIWPTQLLFCWFNFVYGMTIFDFAKDRGMSAQHVSYLIPCWVIGQLFGRLFLSSLVDLKLLTYKAFTIICFANIGAASFLLNHTQLDNIEGGDQYQYLIVYALVFVLSMFIALLYILLNALVVTYMDTPLQPLTFGISSFISSFPLLLRARFIGYYRDTFGNYDAMLTMLTCLSLCVSYHPYMNILKKRRETTSCSGKA